jgi:hypothetical protein
MDIVSSHYNDFKRTFTIRDNNRGRRFDDDSFNDAFIKCAQKFGNAIISYDDAIRYFWIAYVNTTKGSDSKKSKSCFDSLDDMEYDCIDEDEQTYATYIYNIVMNAVTEAYGYDDMMIYSLYKYHGWTEQELIDAGYDVKNLDVRIKVIHKFVKTYCKKHISK